MSPGHVFFKVILVTKWHHWVGKSKHGLHTLSKESLKKLLMNITLRAVNTMVQCPVMVM